MDGLGRAGAHWRVLTAVDNVFQFLPPSGSLFFVNPLWWEPVVGRNQPKFDFAIYNIGDMPKLLLVETA